MSRQVRAKSHHVYRWSACKHWFSHDLADLQLLYLGAWLWSLCRSRYRVWLFCCDSPCADMVSSQTGLIAGLVVSGFGLASVYIAPLSEYLLKACGIHSAMMIFAVLFLIVVCGLSLLMVISSSRICACRACSSEENRVCQRSHTVADVKDTDVLEYVGDLFYRRRCWSYGHRQCCRHGKEKHGGSGVLL